MKLPSPNNLYRVKKPLRSIDASRARLKSWPNPENLAAAVEFKLHPRRLLAQLVKIAYEVHAHVSGEVVIHPE